MRLCSYTPAEVDHARFLASALCTGDLVLPDFQEKSTEGRAKYPNPHFPAVIAAIIPSELILRSAHGTKAGQMRRKY